MTEFTGLRAIVTGGGSGVGLCTARMLVERGADVAVLDLDPSAALGSIHRLQCDIGGTAPVIDAVSRAAEVMGGIDILVNNAASGAIGSIEDNPEAEWMAVLNVNVLGLVRVTRAALPHLRRSHAAAIVNVGSVVAEVGAPGRALLTASKGALHALTRAMAADHVHEGIRVNGVHPGTIDTPAADHVADSSADPAATRAAMLARQPTGRLVSPDEVAHAICHLASPLSGSTTGTFLTVDGGITGVRVGPRP